MWVRWSKVLEENDNKQNLEYRWKDNQSSGRLLPLVQ
jgi:hypothetical protein